MTSYFEDMVLSASPLELIRLLYRKAIASIGDAREHLKQGRIAERSKAINAAYAVLLELTAALRDSDAPELVARLKDLYVYMQGRLIDANLRQVEEPLTEVLGLLTTLADAWNILPEPSQASPELLAAASGMRFAVSA